MSNIKYLHIVIESLNNAIENGYDNIKTDEPSDIADDLHNYDSQFENIDPTELIPAIIEWQKQQTK